MIIPSLSSLLPQPTRKLGSYDRPLYVAHTMLCHKFEDDLVLMLCPRTLDETGLEHFLPAVETLHVRPLVAKGDLANALPVSRPRFSTACFNALSSSALHFPPDATTPGGSTRWLDFVFFCFGAAAVHVFVVVVVPLDDLGLVVEGFEGSGLMMPMLAIVEGASGTMLDSMSISGDALLLCRFSCGLLLPGDSDSRGDRCPRFVSILCAFLFLSFFPSFLLSSVLSFLLCSVSVTHSLLLLCSCGFIYFFLFSFLFFSFFFCVLFSFRLLNSRASSVFEKRSSDFLLCVVRFRKMLIDFFLISHFFFLYFCLCCSILSLLFTFVFSLLLPCSSSSTPTSHSFFII